MKHKSPKQLRQKKRNPYILDDWLNVKLTTVEVTRSRADRLPPYEEYNPNKIHVARRRRAWQDHTSFPRGWIWQSDETGDIHIISPTEYDAVEKIMSGGWDANDEDIN